MANQARIFVQSALLVSFAGLGCNAILGIGDPRTEVPADVPGPEEAGGPSVEADASSDADAAGRTCYMQSYRPPPGFMRASIHPGKCTPAQISDARTNCPSLGGAGCDAFIKTNPDCARCMFGALNGEAFSATPIPALIPTSRATNVTPNIAACAALVIGRPDCAVKLTEQVVCTESACATCESAAASNECSAIARAAVCRAVTDSVCFAAVNAATAQWQPICFGTSLDDTYFKVATYLCGSE